MAAHLSSELAASRGLKTLPVRKGDTVRIERGDNKGFEGKVSRVDLSEYRIYLEGLTREKVDGTNIFISVHPSKVQIRNLNLDDKRRKDILGRKKEIEKPERGAKLKAKAAKKAEKPKEKPEAKAEEKLEEAPIVEEKAMPEAVEEQAPAAKKTPAKKPTAKKEVEEEEAPVKEEKAPTKKVTATKTAVKEATAKETVEKKTTPKPHAKRKTSE